jgi:hypothetical protein
VSQCAGQVRILAGHRHACRPTVWDRCRCAVACATNTTTCSLACRPHAAKPTCIGRCRYVTNTNIKIIILLDDEQPVKDEQLAKVLRRLHALYVDTVSNPFHTLGMPIKSARFEQQLEAIVTSYPKPPGSVGGFQS